ILADFARREPKVKVLTIADLPPGWLGKNHALYQGYATTTAAWMLFTDADVVYDPDALTKAMHYTRQQHLDYLTILPEIKSRSGLLVGVISTFKIMLEFKLRPWAVRNPKTKAYMGVGAFMLVKRAAYEKAGTHQALALRPDDDLKLGELLKKAGFGADVLYGDKQIWLEWYTSIREFTQGLMKNTFAVANYNVFIALIGVIATLIAFVLPWPLLLLFGGATERWLALIIFLFQTLLYLPWKNMEIKGWHVLLMPLAGLLISYIILKSTYLTLKQGGIYWRDSFYSLADLRKKY
ncbi:MAG: glycosyltransferase, partial [Adhaeribacter sp.]